MNQSGNYILKEQYKLYPDFFQKTSLIYLLPECCSGIYSFENFPNLYIYFQNY
jgi:hypothetical protein